MKPWRTPQAAPRLLNGNFNIKPFTKQADPNDTAVHWQHYKNDIGRQFCFFGITDPATKKDSLLIYVGEYLVELDDALPDPTGQEIDDVYQVLIRKTTTTSSQRRTKIMPHFNFVSSSSRATKD